MKYDNILGNYGTVCVRMSNETIMITNNDLKDGNNHTDNDYENNK